MTTVKIAPVRKSIHIKASQARAFEVFTSGLGRGARKGRERGERE